MRRVMVKYRTKPERAAENEHLVAAVFAQLQRDAPAGLRYATFKADDGVSFTHLALVETNDGGSPLQALEAFRAFTADIADRCDEPPVLTELSEVGSYRLFSS